MRVLISGGGVAGLTLATLLRRQGKECVVVDRQPEGADLGYVLGLWPQGSRVLHSLGVHDAYVARSEPMVSYSLKDSSGRLVGTFDMQSTIGRFGHIGSIPRPEFIGLLAEADGAPGVRHGVGIESLRQDADAVAVRLNGGPTERFDLVVGADGIHSRVRELLFGRLAEWDTGWGLFAWWGPAGLTAKSEVVERWGAGYFLGLYPCQKSVGIIFGAPADTLRELNRHRDRDHRIKDFIANRESSAEALLASLPDDGPLYLWRMADVRAPRWVAGRVVLVGDAAVAFLPTAGIGASMALESAAVLADVLSRTDTAHLPLALALYERRRRGRVLAAQRQSRWLAKLVFIRSGAMAGGRDRLLRFASLERMVGPILKQLQEPI